MPLGYLRRPLFPALILYMLLLAGLHSRGRLSAAPEPGFPLRRGPASLLGRVVSPLGEDHRGLKLVAAAERLAGRESRARVLVYLAGPAPLPGERARFYGELRLPRRPRNPGEFDERAFLADRGIAWVLRADRVAVEPGPVPWAWRPLRWAELARRSMLASFRELLPEDQARLLAGLCLGAKGALSRELNREIQDAGVMHLLVPSGAKVAFVLLAAAGLAAGLGLPAAARFTLSAAVGGFYTLMVGAEPPYVRAYLGAMALQAGILLDRESGAFQALLLSALALLLLEPRALFSVGFQMTYLAAAGLILAMPSLHRALPEGWPAAARWGAEAAAATAIVELSLWPVFAGTFGRAALLGAAANLPLVPFSALLMAGGFWLWGLSGLPRGRLLAASVRGISLLLAAFCRVCRGAAALPAAAVELSPMSGAKTAAYYLALAALLVWPRRRASAILLAAGALTAAAVYAQTAPPLRVVFFSLPRVRAAWVSRAGSPPELVCEGPPPASVRRALRALGAGVPARVLPPRGESACLGLVCVDFDPPRVRRGDLEFSIMPRLRRGAVEVTTDGRSFCVSDAH